LKRVDDYQKALQYAFLLLRYRDRSENEIIQRLKKKGFSEDTGREVGIYLKDRGFIDDTRFAESLKKTAVEQKHLGRSGVLHYMLMRGIPREIIERVAGDDDDYQEAARAFVDKKMGKLRGLEPREIKRRLWAALARKGFSAAVIARALKSHFDSEEMYQE